MSKINSKRKGDVAERKLAIELTRILGVPCRRGQQRSGLDGEDVIGLPGIHIECKRVENLNLYKAMAQSCDDSGDAYPTVIHRRNNTPWMVTHLLAHWPDVSRRVVEIQRGGLCLDCRLLLDACTCE